jgi:hypothetical protein
MKDLTLEDLKQLVSFYKNKSSDIELEFLKLQIDSAKNIKNLKDEQEKALLELKKEHNKTTLEFNNALDHLKRENNKLKLEKKQKTLKK